jgi:hypothetical protein
MEPLYGSSYHSFEAAFEAIDAFGATLGLSIVIHSKRPNAAKFRRVVLRCCKGSIFKHQAKEDTRESKRRKTCTQKTDCPFRMTVRVGDTGS